MADIFVSYSRSDRPRVSPLVAALEAHGWSVWWDPEITPGDEFDAMIGAELEAARAVVVVWTPASVESRWVKGEARDAADRGILVPVRLDNARLPIDVRSIHTTEIDGWGGNPDSAPFKALCAALEAKLKLSAGKVAAEPKRANRPTVSICVVPFANMSGDPEQEYFSDGITEDIITDLGKVSALSVISRNTAFSFKGSSADVAHIARQTKATFVLAGSVRKSGTRVRITAQLMAAANDAQVWGERFDRDLNDIFSLQDEISKAIVTALKLTLLPGEKQALEQRSTTNPEAYKLYLMARQFWMLDNERSNEIIERICQRAVGLDPHYAQAWAMLALAQCDMYWQHEAGDAGEKAAREALRLDPGLADAHSAMGAVYRSQGKFGPGLLECEEAIRLDPGTYVGHRFAGLCCLGLRRHEEAIRYLEFAAAAMESEFTAMCFISQCYKSLGDAERMRASALKAMDRIEKLVASDPGHSRAIGLGASMLASLGERERAREWAARARLVEPGAVNLQYNLACAMAGLQETDLAVEALSGIVSKLSPGMVSWLQADADFDPIREDSRFRALIDEVKQRLAAS